MAYDLTDSIREWLAEFTIETGEEISDLCVGFDDGPSSGWPAGYWPEGWPRFETNRAMPVAAFGDVLDVRFNSDATGWIKVCGWSPSWVLITARYDGSIWPTWTPRNPTDHRPISAGGG